MELSENAKTVLEARYLLKDESGEVIETPDEMFWRVANQVASAERRFNPELEEKHQESFFDLMRKLLFLPNSPTL